MRNNVGGVNGYNEPPRVSEDGEKRDETVVIQSHLFAHTYNLYLIHLSISISLPLTSCLQKYIHFLISPLDVHIHHTTTTPSPYDMHIYIISIENLLGNVRSFSLLW
jgi:hypothetical protein